MASINSNDIEKKIDTILNNSNVYNFGFVTKINDFVIESTLLEDVFYFEKVQKLHPCSQDKTVQILL